MVPAETVTSPEPEPNEKPPTERFTKRSAMEIAAVLLTGILNMVPNEVFVPQVVFIAMVVVGWGAYVALRVRADRTLPARWGFRRAGCRPAFLVTSMGAVLGMGGMAAIGIALHGALPIHWHMLPLLVLYPLWGLVQQWMVQGIFVRQMALLHGPLGSPWQIVPMAAVLFGLVHVPDWEIMLGTFLMGFIFTPIYLRWRNLWPLGLYHGALGVFVYFWILDVDPLVEIFK